MAEFEHGKMDITTQEKVFAGFVTWITRSSIAIVIFLVFLAMVNG